MSSAISVVVPPFDDDDADVIIKSSDGHEYRLHKAILGKASQIFKDMFRLPQSSPGSSPSSNESAEPPEVIDGLPVVYLTEDTRTLQLVFSFCYPMEHPELASLKDVHRVLEAANKYEMTAVAAWASKAWPTIAAQDPRAAFGVAAMMRWDCEARIAARLMLREPIWPLEPPLPPEYKFVAADTIVRLESYHRQCAEAACRAIQDEAWCKRIYNKASCLHCQGKSGTSTQNLRMNDWWISYTTQSAAALRSRPAARTVRSEDFVLNIVQKTFSTSLCDISSHCMQKIKSAVELFSEEIDTVIGQVKIHILSLYCALQLTYIFRSN
ncbi:hypothetical protein EIP86_005123 [Pleurotus ostreatoroseus]|nr:hypothetical protein EIP86_005123 [Pleurotus ostreatoroseus]